MQYNQSNYGYTNSPAASQSYSASQSYANASFDSLTNSTTNGVNYLLKNNYVRIFIFVLATVYAGYTVMPVPSMLKKRLEKSYLMKYFILFFIAASMLHPLDNDKLKICLIVPVFILLMFRMMRNRSKGKSLFHGIGSQADECSDSESRHSSRHRSRHSETESEGRRAAPGYHTGVHQPAHQPGHSDGSLLAAGAVGVGVGAVGAHGMRDRKHKEGKRSKDGKRSKEGKRSKDGKHGKHEGKHKKDRKHRRSNSSDSVKGMAKTKHFSFI